ncbi:MAG TPA: S8 family serine peptidase, partial [Longimicrobium sp.]|nr:S8 family serine peptidase [Longimicrobium sp.]
MATGNTQCERLTPQGAPMGKAAGNLIPDAQWMLDTQPGAYTRADSTYRISVRLTNDTEGMLGTPDGVQATGLKLFLPVHPMGYTGRQPGDTSDPYGMLVPPIQNTNNTVRARNPDGVGSFTAPGQPFWNYPEMLAPWETSGWKEWKFTVDPNVSYFYFAVSILSYVPGEQPVTSSAPDGWLIPQDSVNQLFAQENLILVHPRASGPYPRNVVLLAFSESASDAEKQAAVDQAGGTVIGGDGAYYFVKVAEGTHPVWTAIDQLSGLPQVEEALPYLYALDESYRRPNNGLQWQRGDWEVHPDSARGFNWGPEAMSAPSAWGCETGSSAVKVSVVDVEPSHAARVAAIVSNPGDTGSGMAGVMWSSDLTVSDGSGSGTQDENVRRALRAAIQRRSTVINMSWAAAYYDAANQPRLPVVGDPSDIAHAETFFKTWRRRIRLYEKGVTPASRPLYVIAAGNNYGIDASYSGVTQLAGDSAFAERVLVVAAHDSTHAGPSWTVPAFSSVGSLVSIAAPGASLNIRTASGTEYTNQQGTSFAAPHVTGLAGLLFSQVPTRTAETVRSYILEGAARGGRTAGGYPIANAYESLKRGAEDGGAPLCGNRVWAFGAQIFARRGPGISEPIGPADPEKVGDIIPQHGGRTILYNSTEGGGTGKALVLQPDGTWQLGAIPGDFNSQIGGATWSERQYAHFPADSIVQLNTTTVNNNNWWRTGSQLNVPIVLRYLQGGAESQKQLGLLTVPDLPVAEQRTCVEKTPGGFCTFTQISGRYWLFRVSYPQAYQPVLITVTPLQLETTDSTAWVTCTRDPSLLCRQARTDYIWSATKVYRIPLRGGTPQLVDSLKSTVFWMGQSEAPGSDSLVMAKGDWHIQYWYDPNLRSYITANSRSEVEGCTMQYRSLGAFATVAQEISNTIQCGWASLTTPDNHGGGSFSPLRAPAPPGTG